MATAMTQIADGGGGIRARSREEWQSDRQLVRTSMPFCFIASIAFFETSLWNAGSSLSADWMIVTFGGVRSAFLYSAWPCSSLSAR